MKYLKKFNSSIWNYLLCIFTILFVFLLFLKTKDRFFWFDEVITFKVANTQTFYGLVDEARIQNGQPPLFYLLASCFQKFNSDSEFLRILPFSFFLFFVSIFLYQLRKNSLLLVLFAIYLIESPFSEYVIVEYRPYSLSLFLYALLFICLFSLIKQGYSLRLFFLIQTSIFLFSLTLSLNLLWGIFLSFFSGALIFGKIPRQKRIIVLGFCFANLSFLTFFLLFLMGHWGSSPPFNFDFFLNHFINNIKIAENSFFLVLNLIFLVSIIVISYSKFRFDFYSNQMQMMLLFLMGSILYQLLLPTYVLHNRIPWFANRYQHLLYTTFPFFLVFLIHLKVDFGVFGRKNYQFILPFVFVFFYFSKYTNLDSRVVENLNKNKSQWFSILSKLETQCSKPFIFVEPSFIVIMIQYHYLLDNPKSMIKIGGDFDQLSDNDCVLYTTSWNLNKNIRNEIRNHNFKSVLIKKVNNGYIENLQEYELFRR